MPILAFRTAVDETYASLKHRRVSNFRIQVDSRSMEYRLLSVEMSGVNE